MIPRPEERPSRPPAGAAEPARLLAHAVLALRSISDLGTACGILTRCAGEGLEASAVRLLRVDSRSGALRLIDESGVETAYLAEPDGPVETVIRRDDPVFIENAGPATSRETLLWQESPAALAALPLFSGSILSGCLLVAFPQPRSFDADAQLFLQAMADALALALQRAELLRMVEEERGQRVELERRVLADEEASANLMMLVAHEIKTPLTAIKAYTEALLDTLANPHTPRERFLGIINEECDRLSRLVTDVLDLSRLEAGQRPLRLTRLDAGAVASEVVEGLRPAAEPRQVQVRVEAPAGLIVEADADLLRRLVANLVSNGIQYARISGRVTLRLAAAPDGEFWSVVVEDDGPGVTAEDLPFLFERFYRGARSGDPQIEGAGLGLAIARGIVELHGGRIWAEPGEAEGSRFGFALPLRQMAAARAREIARQIVGRPDLRRLLEETVEVVAATMEAEIVSLMLVDPDRGDLFVIASCGLEEHKLAVRRTSVRSGVAGTVAARGRPVLVNNIETDRRFRRLNHPQYSTKSLLSVPLEVEGEVLGVLNVNNKTSRASFDDNDLALVSALVERVGSAIERAYAYPDSGRVVDEAAEAIRSITRLKGDGLLGGGNVVGMARGLARALGLAQPDADIIGYAAAVRDLGMGPLRDRVSVPGPLAGADREAVLAHPVASVEAIRPLEYLGPVLDTLRSHHERWDGEGYPGRLRGSEIPLGARILAVVDAYQSMTSDRPYRAARPVADAIAELRAEAGGQFDPEVVEALVQMLRDERLAA